MLEFLPFGSVAFRAVCKSTLAAVLFSVASSEMQCQQDSNRPPYMLRLRHVTGGVDTCALLQQDGTYHFERLTSDNALIAEGVISDKSLKEVGTALDGEELRSLDQDRISFHIVAPGRDEFYIRIARQSGWQQLLFPDAESREPFQKSLNPLVRWLGDLPGKDASHLSEDEGKTNCLPQRRGEVRLTAREGNGAAVPLMASRTPENPYLLRIVIDRLGQGEAKRTCAMVYPNGFYHLEKGRQAHNYGGVFYQPDIVTEGIRGRIKADVFEQFLDATAMTELRRLLDNPDLIGAHPSGLPAEVPSRDSEVTFVLIPRGGDVQRLTFTNYYAAAKVPRNITARVPLTLHMDSAAGVLKPFQKWLQENVESRKGARLKREFGDNCVASPNQAVPLEVSSELAQVAPSDPNSVTAKTDRPIPTGAQTGPSPTPGSPTTPTNLDEQRTADNEPPLSLRVTTRIVLLDVIATDKRGMPITDLRRGDFQVLEDGRPQEVKFFSHTSRDPAHIEKRNPSGLPLNVYSNRPDSGQPTGPLVLLLLDGINTAGTDQAYARRQLLEYVRTLKSDQRVAIFALTTDLLLLQDFTTDPQVLKAALEKYSAQDSFLLTKGVPAQITPQMATALASAIPNPIMANLKRMNQEAAVSSVNERVRATLAALRALARAMIGYPGRKNLIWVSSGFPISIELGGRNFALSQNYAADSAEASKLLSQAQVSVYPVDARGLIANLKEPPGSPGEDPFSDCPSCQDEIVPTLESPSDGSYGAEDLTRIAPLVTDSHMAMRQIAQDTGGRAFYNANNLSAAVAKAVADGSSYYTIGYYPQNKDWNGTFRKITIKTKQNTRLRHRSGYYALDSARVKGPASPQQKQELVRELLRAVGDPLPATGVTFSAQVIPPGPGDTSSYAEFLVDANTVSWTATGDQYACNVDYAVFTVAPNGSISRTTVKTVQTSIPASAYSKIGRQRVRFRMPITSPPPRGSLRLAVRDNSTGLVGTLPIPIPASASQAEVNQ